MDKERLKKNGHIDKERLKKKTNRHVDKERLKKNRGTQPLTLTLALAATFLF